MKIKLCQGLWLVSLNKSLMQIEDPVPSVALQSILQGLWGSPKGLRMNLVENHLLFTGKFFQRIKPTPSHFFLKLIWLISLKGWLRKSPLFFLLLILNHRATKTANFEMCWVGLSSDYVAIDSNSQKSLGSFLEQWHEQD